TCGDRVFHRRVAETRRLFGRREHRGRGEGIKIDGVCKVFEIVVGARGESTCGDRGFQRRGREPRWAGGRRGRRRRGEVIKIDGVCKIFEIVVGAREGSPCGDESTLSPSRRPASAVLVGGSHRNACAAHLPILMDSKILSVSASPRLCGEKSKSPLGDI